MNPTLYTQLSPLGFAEWLEKEYDITDDYPIVWADGLTINHRIRTVFNALAFRWLREEKGIFAYITPYKDHAADNNDPVEYRYLIFKGQYTYYKDYPTHPLAEHEALNKALEILSKGGENGN